MNVSGRLLTVREFRELIGPDKIGRDTAYQLVRKYGIRIGRRLFMPRRKAEAIIEGRWEDLES